MSASNIEKRVAHLRGEALRYRRLANGLMPWPVTIALGEGAEECEPAGNSTRRSPYHRSRLVGAHPLGQARRLSNANLARLKEWLVDLENVSGRERLVGAARASPKSARDIAALRHAGTTPTKKRFIESLSRADARISRWPNGPRAGRTTVHAPH